MKQALRDALDDRGYETLTPVQQAVLADEYQGKDLLVSAQTGSGKTLGFGLAIAPTLLQDAERFSQADTPLALVIAPTRELALQVKRELSWLFAKAGAVMASCVGGMDMRDERRALSRGAHIVVATPGRLRDHIMRGSIDLSGLRSVVLDEADEMLDLGFREDLEFILGESPDDRQTLLFSATVPNSIGQLAQNYQKDAIRVVTKSEATQHADIEYIAQNVAEHDTEKAVINTLLYYQAPNAIVFANTRAMVNRLTTRLSNRGFKVVALSGELSQSERTHALQAMRDGRAQVCVATDVAARGIDLPKLDLVVHAELPSNHETMLHRSGRTGRAGRKGVSALIVTKRSQKKAQRILGMAKVRAEWSNAPSADAVNQREEERMLGDATWQAPIEDSERDTVTKLIEAHSPEQLAAAYLRLYRSVRSSPEELADVNAKPAPRQEFGRSVWFAVTGGRDAGAEPRRLLPMLCKATDLTRDDIGAIRVQQSQSFVQIKESSVHAFLNALGNDKTLEPGAVVSQMAEAPVLDRGPQRGPKPPYKSKRPDREGYGDRPSKPRSSGPIDWNDSPEPRKKKPKPQDRSGPAKKRYDSEPRRDHEGAHGPAKRGPSDHKKPRTGPKGPPPPKGKASSKKNRARTAAAKATGKPGKRPAK
ncbi:MAG: DEAD/DEAH box helicase [Thalassovita sp.]